MNVRAIGLALERRDESLESALLGRIGETDNRGKAQQGFARNDELMLRLGRIVLLSASAIGKETRSGGAALAIDGGWNAEAQQARAARPRDNRDRFAQDAC